MADIPLPPADHAYNSGSFAPLWGEAKMRSHAAAVSAADNAELLKRLGSALEERNTAEVKHADLVDKFEALRADNIRLQNEVVGPLRERVKVLEDALQLCVEQFQKPFQLHVPAGDMQVLDAARAALEKP